jgi:uncharacterized protein YdbL (DUF1318 family)
MKALKIALIALAIVVVMGCITIEVRVSFPEAQFQAAADKIVEKVQSGTPAPQTPQENPAPAEPAAPPSPSSALPQSNWLASLSLISTAYADEKIDINVRNAEIDAILDRMQKNFEQYKPFKDNGSVGENLSGYLEERKEGSSALSGDDQKNLRKLITRENRDRKDLYNALLEANNMDKSNLSKMEGIFAKSWYGKAEPGWYVRYNDPEKGTIWLTKADWEKMPQPTE